MPETQEVTSEKIAKTIAPICHEANRVYCDSVNDTSQKRWDLAEHWQRESAVNGVLYRLNNPDAKPSDQHDAWFADKIKDGWVFGKVKDTALKTHPCLVSYDQLPVFQQKKDALFCGIVDALKIALQRK